MSSPTVVLVHGAFADASSWSGVIAELQGDGVSVVAPPNPLRGLRSDSAYIAAVLGEIEGSVLLVGHSYGGCVISVAAADVENVVGLVYVAAFIPEKSEAVGSINVRYPATPLATSLRPGRYPIDGSVEEGTEVWLEADKFAAVFAADLSAEQVALAAATQRPASLQCFMEPAGDVAWADLPTWAIIAGADRAIQPSAERDMAKRAEATITEIDGASHAVAVSQPKAVADVIRSALSGVAA